MNRMIVQHIASRAYELMRRQKLIASEDRPVFYAWPREGRLVLVVDPEMIRDQAKILSAAFRHDLSTILAGRRVVQTNSRGIFLQIAYQPPPAPLALRTAPLDLSRQPSPLHIPIGSTRTGPFWVSIVEADSILVAGRRRMGKSRMIHGMIQALIHGGQAELYLRDGKGGMEFQRYGAHACVHLAQNNLHAALLELQTEVHRRERALLDAGVTSLPEYNLLAGEKLPALVLVVDEVAHIPEDCRPILADLIGRCGAYGVYPVLGTTYPGYREVGSIVKANIGMRIALKVPTQSESQVILGTRGAEDLPNLKGRMLFEWEGALVEGQAFQVALPDSSARIGPRLAGQELEIAKFAAEGDGFLSINLLKQFFSMTEKPARNLLEVWEARGWLEKDRFKNNARRITPLLLDVLGQSGQGGQTGQTGQTGGEEANNAE